MNMSSRWRTLVAAVGILLGMLGGLSMAQGRAEADWEKLYERSEYRNSSGATLKYRLLRPEKIEAGQRYPLVIFLHGAGDFHCLRGGMPKLLKFEEWG